MPIEVSEEEWKIAEAAAADIRTDILALQPIEEIAAERFPDRKSAFAYQDPLIYLHAEHEVRGRTFSEKQGITGLKHNFVVIDQKVYALGLHEEGAFLGEGGYGKVFLCQNREVETLVVKEGELRQKKNPNEEELLEKLGYWRGEIEFRMKGKKRYRMSFLKHLPGGSMREWYKIPSQWSQLLEVFSPEDRAYCECAIYPRDLKKNEKNQFIFTNPMLSLHSFPSGMTRKEFLQRLSEESARLQAKQQPRTLEQALKVAIAAAEQLKKVFDAGFLHLDVKGANFNIHYDPETEKTTVSILDFDGAQKGTDPRFLKYGIATYAYSAPEVLRGVPYMDRQRYAYTGVFDQVSDYNDRGSYFSMASDIYSFAKMCVIDLGFSEHAPVIRDCLAENLKERPSIENVIRGLTRELEAVSKPKEKMEELAKQKVSITRGFLDLKQEEWTLNDYIKDLQRAGDTEKANAIKSAISEGDLTKLWNAVDRQRSGWHSRKTRGRKILEALKMPHPVKHHEEQTLPEKEQTPELKGKT